MPQRAQLHRAQLVEPPRRPPGGQGAARSGFRFRPGTAGGTARDETAPSAALPRPLLPKSPPGRPEISFLPVSPGIFADFPPAQEAWPRKDAPQSLALSADSAAASSALLLVNIRLFHSDSNSKANMSDVSNAPPCPSHNVDTSFSSALPQPRSLPE